MRLFVTTYILNYATQWRYLTTLNYTYINECKMGKTHAAFHGLKVAGLFIFLKYCLLLKHGSKWVTFQRTQTCNTQSSL